MSPPADTRDLAYFRLKQEIEDFLYEEADLLDQRRFAEWLGLLADDLHYFMPMRRNVQFGLHEARENTRAGSDISWFDEDKWTLSKRVDQIMTGIHWAEEPLSRVCHMISNIRLLEILPGPPATAGEVVVGSRFLVYQNRVETETYFFVGKRTDRLRREAGGWRLARREIVLDQSVLLAEKLDRVLLMLAIQHLVPGTRLRLVDGELVEIHENPRDGTWLVVRRLGPDGRPDAAEDLVHVDEIADLAAD